MNNTHVMGPTTLNHGESQCVNCKATNREIDLALGPVCPNAPTAPVMTDLAKTLADLAAKATPGPWAIGTDVRGSEICTMHGVPTMPTEDGLGQEWLYIEYPRIIDGDWHWPSPEAKLTNAELIVELANNLPAIIAALTAQAEHDKVLAERDGLEAENARLREALVGSVGAMMRAAGRLEILAMGNEDRRIIAALSSTCAFARAALEAKP